MIDTLIPELRSRPSRARGSKLYQSGQAEHGPRVAPFTGAWIETTSSRSRAQTRHDAPSRARGSKSCRRGRDNRLMLVAPSWARGSKQRSGDAKRHSFGRAFTGAWIETPCCRRRCTSRGSRLHGRVDRNATIRLVYYEDLLVASFTGAWIETTKCAAKLSPKVMSRPSRARGSKLEQAAAVVFLLIGSRPSRARGSKHDDAGRYALYVQSRPLWARGLKQLDQTVIKHTTARALHRSLDRNTKSAWRAARVIRRALHGRVDRNGVISPTTLIVSRRALRGAWIETSWR